ncbi:asd, partial [Symbiodinium microadriaticum]
YSPQIVANGKTIVIDNSSAFRYKDDIPLVVPEINSPAAQRGGVLLIFITLLAYCVLLPCGRLGVEVRLALFKFHWSVLSRCFVSFAVLLGTGPCKSEGTRQALENQTHANEVFAHPLPFNVIPHIDAFQSNGYTKAGFCSSVSAEYRILNGFQCCSQAFLITFTA